jgi:hypothetical protein
VALEACYNCIHDHDCITCLLSGGLHVLVVVVTNGNI